MSDLFDTIKGIFNGEMPIERQERKPGESKYYLINPGQEGKRFSELETTDIPDEDEEKGPLISQLPVVVGTVVSDAMNLYSKKKEMEKANQVGYDNYAHRLVMCENAQNGPLDAVISFGGGIIKEAYDLHKKIPQQGIVSPVKDSIKDMSNNIEGLQYGLTHPFNNCRTWLNNLDYENNKWKK